MIELFIILAFLWLMVGGLESLLEWWSVKDTEKWNKERDKKL